MKRVGIITIHNSPNYGACLQSFALYEYIRQQGYDVYVINLYRPYHSDYVESLKFKPYIHRFETLKQRIFRIVRDLFRNIISLFHNKHNRGTIECHNSQIALINFNSFNSRIRLTRPFCSIDELYLAPPEFDTYITGSDQVWNPTQSYCIEPYFLTFVKRGRKISYASSIGIEELTDLEKKQFKRWLRSYDAVSVREHSAQKILSKLTGQKITQVCDPTFLLGKKYWNSISVKPNYTDYILLFTLSFNKEITEYAINLSKESNKVLICINTDQLDDNRYVHRSDCTPEEWLGFIQNADMLLTDSFHCTLFSILLGTKNFHTYISPWNTRGSRITDLLKTFHVMDHLLAKELNESYKILSDKKIDYLFVESVIESESQRAKDYLLNNI